MTSLPPTTMEPEDICVSLETAKRLKEAGWPQEMGNTYFVWRDFMHYGEFKVTAWPLIKLHEPHYAAPTSEEVLRELPKGTMLYFCGDGAKCCNEFFSIVMAGETPSEAVSSLWIYLKTNNLLP